MPTYDEDYVKKLREEAAGWRVKYRELETQNERTTVEAELAKRGIKADPNWVSIEQGQSVGDAIDNLVEQYPHLKAEPITNEPGDDLLLDLTPAPKQRTMPKPIAPSSQNTTNPKPVKSARITSKNITEIRKDPQTRAKVRDLYRELLTRGSNQGE